MKNIRTKMTALVLALCVLVGLWPAVSGTAQAADNMENATAIAVGTPVQVTFKDYSRVFYSFQTTKPGQFIQVTAPSGVSVGIFDGNETWFESYRDGTTVTAASGERGTNYIRLSPNGLTVPATVSFTVNLVDNDEYECNNTMATAAKIEAGKTVDFVLGCQDVDWFAIETTKPGQILHANMTWSGSDYYGGVSIFDADGNSVEKYGSSGTNYRTESAVSGEAGTYYIKCWRNGENEIVPVSLTVTLEDNDDYEPNGTKEKACELTGGQAAEVTLGYYDEDWFAIETTKPGQDIQIDISGFNYANEGSVDLSFDERNEYLEATGNRTFYFHAAEAGKHYFKLYDGRVKNENGSYVYSGQLNLAVTATVLDGDKHESKGNECAEDAVTLNLGTDETFQVGGWGDEDWFAFEVAESGLYTLQFKDLNPDYSDKFYYEVYAPDGTVVADRTLVSIYHSNILSCDQQGLYKVRIYSGWYGYSHSIQYVDITRSELRIRVSMGGADPYENNDTWPEAKPIQPGQLTQHVLASSTDYDWFYFTAEEADMSFVVDHDSTVSYSIYRAEELAEFGSNAQSVSSYFRGKLYGAGVYYIRMSTGTSYASEELRSFTITLEPHAGEENNDTWDKAAPIYEGAPREFDFAGNNDTDWFKFTVPEGATKAKLLWTERIGYGIEYYVYREEDIINVGLDAKPVYSGNFYNGSMESIEVSEGTYYIKVYDYWHSSDYALDCTLTYYLFYPTAGSTIADAVTLAPGVWSEERSVGTYYSLGQLKAGDVVRYSRDISTGFYSGNSSYVSLYNSAGSRIDSSDYANDGLYVSQDGAYYLYVPVVSSVDANGESYTTRIRYDIGTGSDYATTMEGPDTITMKVGEKRFVDLRLAPYTAKGSTNYIYLDNNTVSSVAIYNCYTGYVTASSLGSTQMTFKVWCDGKYLTKTVTVNVVEPVAATGVSISGAPAEMELGSSAKLTATLTPVEATEDVVWSSSDKSVLYVSPIGKVVAVGEGTAVITASVAAGSDSVTIKVAPAQLTEDEITGVELNEYALTMYMGEGTQKLTATVLPEGIAAAVQWTSSNTAVATVDQNGVVTAVAPGISIITAAAGDYTASCIVTVQAARVRVTGISFPEEKLQIPLGGQTTLLPTIEPYNATTKTLTWVSDDESVATVSRTGIVNALAVGVTTIRATTMDGGFVAEITIEVTAKPQLGDINGDGRVDSADARITLQVAVGLRTLTEEEKAAADVNKDGFVDAGDGVKILRYDAKLIDSLE